MAYAAASQVAALTYNLLDGQRVFGEDTRPTIKDVNSWLSSGCSVIETRLAGCDYVVPVASTAAIYPYVQHLNAIYAAGWAELSRTTATVSPDERTRGQVFLEMFEEELEKLCPAEDARDLTGAGLAEATARGKPYAGGISVADKNTRETDTDRVKPRFGREQFRFPETIRPDISSGSPIAS